MMCTTNMKNLNTNYFVPLYIQLIRHILKGFSSHSITSMDGYPQSHGLEYRFSSTDTRWILSDKWCPHGSDRNLGDSP
jgi:hypothetical protein